MNDTVPAHFGVKTLCCSSKTATQVFQLQCSNEGAVGSRLMKLAQLQHVAFRVADIADSEERVRPLAWHGLSA